MKLLKLLILMGFLSNLFGCAQKDKASNKNAETPITMEVPNIEATADQKERRARSEKICKSKGVPFYKNPNSLFVEAEEEVKIRSKDEVVDRALALLYLGLKSEGLEKVHLDKMDEAFQISSKLSPEEKKYADAVNPTQQQKTNANWRYESLHVLLWSLGYIDELVYPDKMCTVSDDVKIIYERGSDKFREESELRTKKEILDEADLILRLHWACVSARLKSKAAPGGLNQSVVMERHHTLNWLIRYLNQEWDDVTTDT